MALLAEELSQWAVGLQPSSDDAATAERALMDTVAVTLAARDHPVLQVAKVLADGPRWAVGGHVLDFDDLHLPSTAHVSSVCVPATLAMGGDVRAFLAAAGVMSRLGTALGWRHYSAGWHTTCTAGAPAAAVAAGMAMGLSVAELANAIALAIPGAGGLQQVFGTDGKSLQVGFAVHAGIRGAQLAAAGAKTDISVLDGWIDLMAGPSTTVDLGGSAIPGGLAIKMFPCCYALQRPISALAQLGAGRLDTEAITRVVIRTPEATVAPLIHHRPNTGLQAKFSLEYAAATSLLDTHQGLASFSDRAVCRPEAGRLMEVVDIELSDGGDWLLGGAVEVEVHTGSDVLRNRLQYPPGSPRRPPTDRELMRKMRDCLGDLPLEPGALTWSTAPDVLRRYI